MRKYKCPECGEENTSDQWNESTISHYHKAGYTNTSYDNINAIQDSDSAGSWHYCPSCGKKIDGKYIKRIVTNDSNKK